MRQYTGTKPATIYSLGEKFSETMRVLVTAGGTREPIDGVRVIANTSTGRTGVALAEAFSRAGFDVVLVRASAVVSDLPGPSFGSVAELDLACEAALSASAVDLVVHAAAVSDYVVSGVIVDGVRFPAPLTQKLDSAKALQIELIPGVKILPKLKSYSINKSVRLVAFKLTDNSSESEKQAAIQKLFSAGADLVVHNDLRDASGETDRRATLFLREGETQIARDLPELARKLITFASASEVVS
jgi:phosphopantothenoylcysteine synthetase/decarboxylase